MTFLRSPSSAPLLMAVLLLPAGFADTKLKKSELPEAVRKAADKAAQGAQVTGYGKEIEDGKTFYEVETKVGGLTRDITFDAQGKTIAVEQEVTLASLPAPVQEGLKKAAGKGRITKVESVTKGGAVSYEAAVKGGAKKEVIVDSTGAPAK